MGYKTEGKKSEQDKEKFISQTTFYWLTEVKGAGEVEKNNSGHR